MIKKKGKNRKTKILYKKKYIYKCTTVWSWMSILCLSLDYCNIYTISENNNAL